MLTDKKIKKTLKMLVCPFIEHKCTEMPKVAKEWLKVGDFSKWKMHSRIFFESMCSQECVQCQGGL